MLTLLLTPENFLSISNHVNKTLNNDYKKWQQTNWTNKNHTGADKREAEQHSLKHSHIEVVLQVAQVLPNHLLAQPLPGEKELGHCLRGVLQETSTDEVGHPFLRLLVEQVEADPVLPLPDHLWDLV